MIPGNPGDRYECNPRLLGEIIWPWFRNMFNSRENDDYMRGEGEGGDNSADGEGGEGGVL